MLLFSSGAALAGNYFGLHEFPLKCRKCTQFNDVKMYFKYDSMITGPSLLINLRSLSEKDTITKLLTQVSPEKFRSTFGAPMEKASGLLAAKTLSIGKLLALAPPGTLDPAPHLQYMIRLCTRWVG